MRLSPVCVQKIYSCYRFRFQQKCQVIEGNAISGISFPEVSPEILAPRVLRSGESVIRVIGHNRPLPDKYITLVRLAIKITFLRSLSEATLLSLSAWRVSRLLKIFIAAAPCRSESLTRSVRAFAALLSSLFFSFFFFYCRLLYAEKAPRVS